MDHGREQGIFRAKSRPALAGFLIFAALAALAGCAKTGDPHPPILLIPKPPTDLAVRQSGDQAVLSVSLPTENTNGSPVTTLATVELLRATESDRQNERALPMDEFLRRAEILFAIPAGDLGSFLRDNRLVLRDPLTFPDRSVIYQRGFRYAFRFVNRKNQAAGLTNQVFSPPVAIPASPRRLSGESAEDAIRIQWEPATENMDGSKPPRIVGYNVYRSADPKSFPAKPLNAEPLPATGYEDRDFRFDSTYYYQVSVVGSRESPVAESVPSVPLKVVAEDKFPPGAPQNLNAIVDKGVVILLWAAPPQQDVAGYRVYRSEEGGGERAVLSQSLVVEMSYRDGSAQLGKKYVYVVTAVDTHGNEGPPAKADVEVR